MPNIAIVWDFDGTLTPDDSTTKVVEFFHGDRKGEEFWQSIKALRGDKKSQDLDWEHVLASDAPIWMYSLSRLAFKNKAPLNQEFFQQFIAPKIVLYPNVIEFLESIKTLEKQQSFRRLGLKVHHFIVSAGLKELVELNFPKGLIRWTFGCRYKIIAFEGNEAEPESVPVFCMDETMKTRSLFEISKGSFNDSLKQVNRRLDKKDLWAPFENIIYVGDGPTDVPALSLTRDRGGMGIVLYNPEAAKKKVQERFKEMRLDKRADMITEADFSVDSELYDFIVTRCKQIRQRYEAERSDV